MSDSGNLRLKSTRHRYGDERIVEFLNQSREWDSYQKDVPYHPQSPLDGAAQCEFLLEDLLFESEVLSEAASNGDFVYDTDHDIGNPKGLNDNADLVIGPPENTHQSNLEGSIARGNPREVWFASDPKAIMTEHRKARKNRKGAQNRLAAITKEFHEKAVFGGLVLLNLAEKFDSPNKDPGEVNEHSTGLDRIVREIVDDFDVAHEDAMMDFASVVAVDHTNLVEDIGTTELVTQYPAPQSGDKVHYRTFVREVAETMETRFFE